MMDHVSPWDDVGIAQVIARALGWSHEAALSLVTAAGGFPSVLTLDARAVVAAGFDTPAADRFQAIAMLARSYRVFHGRRETPALGNPDRIWELSLAESWHDDDRESFRVWCVDSKMRSTTPLPDVIAIGQVNEVEVHAREVFRPALRRNAVGVLLIHNHPSGDATPSKRDDALTLRMIDAGRLLGVPVIDHVIVASRGFFSYADDKPGVFA